MSPLLWALVAVAAVLVIVLGWWLSWTARRLDRLHHRLDLAEASLSVQLQSRAALALELGTAGLLDPASSLLLIDAAAAARRGAERPDHDPETQSQLSQTLRLVLPETSTEESEGVPELAALSEDPHARELFGELAAASRKVELARRFHNDQVSATRALRSRRRVRWLRLAGNAPEPRTVDFDDLPPAVFSVETAGEPGHPGPRLDPAPSPPSTEDLP